MDTIPKDTRDRDECANCCALFEDASSGGDCGKDLDNYRTRNRTKVVTLTLKMNGKDQTVPVMDALTKVYGLDWFRKIEAMQAETWSNDLNLCLDCCVVFSQLYKLFSEFQLIRKAESIISERLETIRSVIDLLRFEARGKDLGDSSFQCAPVTDWEENTYGEELRNESEKLPETNGINIDGGEDGKLFGVESESFSPVVDCDVALLDHNYSAAGHPISYSVQNSPLCSEEGLLNDSRNVGLDEPTELYLTESGEIVPAAQASDSVPAQILNSDCGERTAENSRIQGVDDALRMYECVDCSMNFKTATELKTHRSEIHRSSVIYKCNVCAKVFSKGSNLRRHIKLHSSGRPYQCKICSLVFTASCYVKRHIILAHRTSVEKNWELVKLSSDTIGQYSETETDKFPGLDHNFNASRPTSSIMSEEALFSPAVSSISPGLRATVGSNAEEILGLDCDERIPLRTAVEEVFSGLPSYGCVDCKMTFTSVLKLGKHRIDVHRSSEVYKCHICMKVVTTCDSFGRHMSRHSSARPYKCRFCSAAFKEYLDVRRHIISVHKTTAKGNWEMPGSSEAEINELPGDCNSESDAAVGPSVRASDFQTVQLTKVTDPVFNKCQKCSETFRNDQELNQHVVAHSQPTLECGAQNAFRVCVFLCRLCTQTFTSNVNLAHHLTSVHVVDFSFRCTVCSSLVDTFEEWTAHMITHSEHECLECGKTFNIRKSLLAHQRRHTEQRKYRCGICRSKFKVGSDIGRHVRQHMKNMDRKFGSGSAQMPDGADYSRPYVCNICEAGFPSVKDLTLHVGIHSDVFRDDVDSDRQCVCKVCQRSFTSHRNLRLHLVNHSGSDGRPFCCEHCGDDFNTHFGLSQHQQLHAEDAIQPNLTDELGEETSLDAAQSSLWLSPSLSVPLVDEENHGDSFPGPPPPEFIPLVFKCTDCEDEFHSAVTLGAHRSSAHQAADLFKCHFCWQSFLHPNELRLHLTEHFAGGIRNDLSTMGPGSILQVMLSEELQTKEEFDEPDVIMLD